MKLKQIETKAALAIKALRKAKLENGIRFMINNSSLPSNHCFFEFPDGRIAEFTLDKKINNFRLIRELSKEEIFKLRKKYKLDYQIKLSSSKGQDGLNQRINT